MDFKNEFKSRKGSVAPVAKKVMKQDSDHVIRLNIQKWHTDI